MSTSSAGTKKSRGRPPTGAGTQVQVRLQPSELELLDAWIARQDEAFTRPAAIRVLMTMMLNTDAHQRLTAGDPLSNKKRALDL